jgi:hypothetical protein
MTARSSNRATNLVPDPADYGRKGNLSLGSDLLKWFRRRVEELYFAGKPPPNALFYYHLWKITADDWANSGEKALADLGNAVSLVLGPSPNFEAAGLAYRKLYSKEAQRLGAIVGQLGRSKHSVKMAVEEFSAAEKIQAQRKRMGQKPLSIRALGDKITIQFSNRDAESIRKRLSKTYKKLKS